MEMTAVAKSSKCRQVYRHIHDFIGSAETQIGDCLPSELELAARFNVNRMTVAKAMSILESEGYLFRNKRAGTTIIKKPAGEKKDTIIVLAPVPQMLNQTFDYYLDFMKGIQIECLSRRLKILSVACHDDSGSSAGAIAELDNLCAASNILGFIVADSYLADQPDILKAIEGKPIPSVWVASGEQGGVRKNVIDINDEKAAFELTNILLESGCGNPVFMAPNLDTIARRNRLRGFKRALLEAGIPFDDRNVLFSSGKMVMKDWGRDCAGLCLSRKLTPAGVFLTDFELIDGVFEYLAECGQERLGQDWHCVAFDCEPTYHPSFVATVVQPIVEIGATAVRTLLARSHGQNETVSEQWVPVQIKKRA